MELSRRKADREEIMIVNIIKARKITLLLTLLTILISIPIIVPIMAQAIPIGTSHSVTLTWTAPIVTSGLSAISGYNIYRAPVVGAVNYVKLNTVINVPLTYTDTTVTSGSGYLYCDTMARTNGDGLGHDRY